MTEKMGLREVKRQTTAHELARAAFELAQERGVDSFTIDEVAARAGYSRRTFANHFAGKEEAIVAVALEQVRQGLDASAEEELPLLDWLQMVAKKQLSGGLLTVLRELRTLADGHPGLRPHLLEVQRLIRESALASVMDRVKLSGNPGNKIYAHLLVGAAYGALSCVLEGQIPVSFESATDRESQSEKAMSLDGFLNLTFKHLRAGF